MTPLLRKTSAQLGYDDPSLLFHRIAWMSATFALATVAGKFFVKDLNIKSHFVFGQLSSLTVNLIFYNDYIGRNIVECPNPLKKDLFYVIHHLAFILMPVMIGKLVVNRYFGNVTWIQAAKRGIYFGGFGIATLCATEIYKRGQKK
ncbi:MAG: hypothetical protein KDK96_01540 [Chlamydiia bacterium]|nr:hypothetical protein [Chlamydiia bacterium]